MKTIDYNELLEKVNQDRESIKLLNALKPSPIRSHQIPNSLNIHQREDILKSLNRDDEIIVYCSDNVCNQSINLYYLLVQLGYNNVTRYAGGIKEWEQNGQALEDIWSSSAA
jgi:rhodanese-related sulfurtransferase